MPEINWFYLWGILVFLVLLGIVGYTYKEISRTKRQNNRRHDIYRDGIFAALRARDDGSLYTLIKGENRSANSKDADNASDEVAGATRALMVWTAVLAGATVLVAYFAYFTLDAIRGQLDEMRAEQRPLISVRVDAIGPLTFDSQGVHLHVRYFMTNLGRSPAMNTTSYAEIFIRDAETPQQAIDRERSICDQTRTGDVIGMGDSHNRVHQGFVIFPGVTAEPDTLVTLVSEYRSQWRAQIPTIVGCVDYIFGTSHHQTGILRELDRAGAGGELLMIDPNGGEVPKDELRLPQAPFLTPDVN